MGPSSKLSLPFLRNSVILILLFHLSSHLLINARVMIDRRIGFREGNDKDLLEKPEINGALVGVNDDDLAVTAKHSPTGNHLSYNSVLENDVEHELQRTSRNAVFRNKENYNKESELKGIKHVQRIPSFSNSVTVKHGTPPPQEESSDEETFESLEANREAFIEILNDNAKHPHRKRSSKRRNDKMILKFDEKAQHWSLTEQQSDEWF